MSCEANCSADWVSHAAGGARLISRIAVDAEFVRLKIFIVVSQRAWRRVPVPKARVWVRPERARDASIGPMEAA